MNNQLFLTCPISKANGLIKSTYGPECYILHALGAVFNFNETRYKKAFSQFLNRESIGKISIVHDLQGQFLTNTILGESSLGYPAEDIFKDIYEKHKTQFSELKHHTEKVRKLSILHMKRLANELKTVQVDGNPMITETIEVNGLIIDKQNIEEVDLYLEHDITSEVNL